MKVFHYTDCEPFSAEALGLSDAQGLSIRFLITQNDGAPNFAMMHLQLLPGGHTPEHSHGWEEEIFIKSGTGTIRGTTRTKPVRKGDVIYIGADESHQIINNGPEDLELLCVIPNPPK